MKISVFIILVFPLFMSSAFSDVPIAEEIEEISKLDRLFFSNGNLKTARIETQSGVQNFVVNKGFLEGANLTKLFGKNRPTTLWGDERREECYEMTLRIMAQLPSGDEITSEKVQALLKKFGLSAEVVSGVGKSLDALHTNYIDGSTLVGKLQNPISKALRNLNPKSVNGVKIPCTNLHFLGQAMQTLNYGTTIVDFAIGAAIQEALSGDIALGRLDYLDGLLKKQNAMEIDPVILQALTRTKESLVRSSDYWGALLVELHDRRSEARRMGVKIFVRTVQKDAVKLLTKYYAKHMGAKAAATKASAVGGLWAFSLVATYETIEALLEQHKRAQIAVTSASVAHLVAQTIANGKAQANDVTQPLMLQAQYFYYDQMVKTASGLLPAFYDLLSIGQPYGDVKAHFTAERSSILAKLRDMKAVADNEILGGASQLDEALATYKDVEQKTIDLGNDVTMEFVLIPAGSFNMGSPSSEKDRYDREGPVRRVQITRSFYMSRYEVTQEQYKSVTGENPSSIIGKNLPVEHVTWSKAVAFCRRLGSGFRLPTEAEWEYACRAGTDTRFYYGDDLDYSELREYAWYEGNSGGKIQAVGQLQPNSFGLYDMHGNVYEWCQDWYDGSYPNVPSIDPIGPSTGRWRVLRGGSDSLPGKRCRSANRDRGELYNHPFAHGYGSGFRVVLETSLYGINSSKLTASGNKRLQEAVALYTGTGGKLDYEKAKSIFEDLANTGNTLAQMWIARFHYNGYCGFKQDERKAKKIASKVFNDIMLFAEASNNLEAIFLTGSAYEQGLGVKTNPSKAVTWYRKAAEKGDAVAQNNLGRCYFDGFGVDKDYHEAVMWYSKAAEKGNTIAQINLGGCYFHGNVLDKDYSEAVKWYRRAAEKGDAAAQMILGTCYLNGYGVDKDYFESMKWYRKAAEQGNASAQEKLEQIKEYTDNDSKLNEAPKSRKTDTKMVPINLELPKPMFVGTPQDTRVPNLEKPLGKPRPPFLAPEGTVNLALGKPVSCSNGEPVVGKLEMITDGNKEANEESYVELQPFLQHVTIDLEQKADIYGIFIWHYHMEPRVYYDVLKLTDFFRAY